MPNANELLRKNKLRIEEAAHLLEVTPRTVQRYLDSGKLTPSFMPGGQRRVKTEELKRYL